LLSSNVKGSKQGNSTNSGKSLIPAWVFPAGAGLVFVMAVSWITPIAWAYLNGDPIPSKVRNNSDVAGWFVVHVFTGTYALLFGAFQMHEPLRNSRRDLHRRMGRVYVVLVFISALTSLALDPRLSIYGTDVLRPLAAALWIGFTVLGVLAIRKRNIDSHRRWMTRSYAMAYMGLTFLLLNAFFKNIGMTLEIRYPLVIWLSLLVNVSVAELILWRSNTPSTEAQAL
jgi:uncharacterized membrane protein